MFLFLYHCLVTLILLTCFPFFLFVDKKRLREKLGLTLPEHLPMNENIWIHALSVGEVISAIPLVRAVKEKYPEKTIVFSASTRQGLSLAGRRLADKVDFLVPMPADFWWSIRRVVHRIRPALFLLVETDIWPGLLLFLRKKGVKCLLVNGRISPHTFRLYRWAPYLTRKLFEPFEKCLMQSDLDRDRLLKLGLDKKRVIMSGNIKFDHPWPPMQEREWSEWAAKLRLESKHIVFTAGSTHPGEEEILLDTYKKIHEKYPVLRLVIAPRKIERAGDLLKLVDRSDLIGALKTRVSERPDHYDVLILDTMGELGRLYGLARISFVGGSLVPFGGHNLLEPASFGCPVFFGPHTENFVRMSEGLLRAGGGCRILDGDELYGGVIRLLSEPELCSKMGERAKKFVFQNKGALAYVMGEINDMLHDGKGIR